MISQGPGSKLASPKTRKGPALISDPDPMIQALFTNILTLENVLRQLQSSAVNFVKANNVMCLSMQTLAANISHFCVEEEALREDSVKYTRAVGQIAGSGAGSARSHLSVQIESKVLGPINVNLTVLAEVKTRMLEREELRKALQPRPRLLAFGPRRPDPKLPSAEDLDKLTLELFEELTALYQHRFDFIRGPYQALKTIQHSFFETAGSSLVGVQAIIPRIPTLHEEMPKVPPPKTSKSAVDLVRETPSLQDSKAFLEARTASSRSSLREELARRSESVKRVVKSRFDPEPGPEPAKEEPVPVAVPLATSFNPDADRPSAGSAYLRLGRAKGSEAIGSSLHTNDAEATKSSLYSGADEIGPIQVKIGKSKQNKSLDKGALIAVKETKSKGGSGLISMPGPKGSKKGSPGKMLLDTVTQEATDRQQVHMPTGHIPILSKPKMTSEVQNGGHVAMKLPKPKARGNSTSLEGGKSKLTHSSTQSSDIVRESEREPPEHPSTVEPGRNEEREEASGTEFEKSNDVRSRDVTRCEKLAGPKDDSPGILIRTAACGDLEHDENGSVNSSNDMNGRTLFDNAGDTIAYTSTGDAILEESSDAQTVLKEADPWLQPLDAEPVKEPSTQVTKAVDVQSATVTTSEADVEAWGPFDGFEENEVVHDELTAPETHEGVENSSTLKQDDFANSAREDVADEVSDLLENRSPVHDLGSETPDEKYACGFSDDDFSSAEARGLRVAPALSEQSDTLDALKGEGSVDVSNIIDQAATGAPRRLQAASVGKVTALHEEHSSTTALESPPDIEPGTPHADISSSPAQLAASASDERRTSAKPSPPA